MQHENVTYLQLKWKIQIRVLAGVAQLVEQCPRHREGTRLTSWSGRMPGFQA